MPSPKKSLDKSSKEKTADLKKQTVKENPVQKGYNEKNPAQPQGAFKPDNKS